MTIKELSKACGVSEQAIRGWCRKNKVPKAAKGNGFAINETTETAILLHYGAINAKAAKANESSSETMFLIEILQKELDFCKKQLESKDEQIVTLQKSLESTTEELKASQESLKASQLFQAQAQSKLYQIEQQEKVAKDEEKTQESEKKHWWSIGKRGK